MKAMYEQVDPNGLLEYSVVYTDRAHKPYVGKLSGCHA